MKMIALVLATARLAVADDSIMREAPGHASDGVLVTPSVAAGFEHFHYEETGSLPTGQPGVLDQHTAFLPTATVAAEASVLGNHLFARGELTLTGGSMTYVGATMQGVPVSGPTTGSMTHEELVIGGRGQLGRSVRLGGYFGFDHRTWDRDLRPVGAGGYREQYAWSSLPVGILAEYAPSSRLVIVVEGTILVPTWHGHIQASDLHTDDGRLIDVLRITTVPDFGDRIRINARAALTRSLRLLVSLGLEHQRNIQGPGELVRINRQPLTTPSGDPLYLAEPYSYTNRIIAEVGAGYTF
jgi:hypothetical protein